MIISATNGVDYTITKTPNLEISKPGKLYVLEDLSIAKSTKKREVVLYSYDVDENGERTNRQRVSFKDFPAEFESFITSEIWAVLENWIIADLLRKIEYTEQAE